MQKLFNVMSAAAFTMSGALVVGTVAIYTRIPTITNLYLNQMKLELTEMVTNMLPAQVEKAVPQLPKQTGLPILD